MINVAAALEDYLVEHFSDGLRAGGAAATVRPILAGPPVQALEALFQRLTTGATADWHVPIDGTSRRIVVLLVRADTATIARGPSKVMSQICGWDYAVTMRNSHPLTLILVEPGAWDTRHESLANTTQVLGSPRTDTRGRLLRGRLWQHLLEAVQARGYDQAVAREAVGSLIQHSDLDPVARDRVPWAVLDDLLAPTTASLSAMAQFARAVGLPAPSGNDSTMNLAEAVETVRRLGALVGEEGLASAIHALCATPTGTGLAPALVALQDHLQGTVHHGTEFARAPLWFYRPRSGAPPTWWISLTQGVLKAILDELDVPVSTPDRITLTCINALNLGTRAAKEPAVVRGQVILEAISGSGGPATFDFARRVARGTPSPLARDADRDDRCTDVSVPPHDRPLKYSADAPGHRTASVEVIDLDHFACHGFARVTEAERCAPPARKSKGVWLQDIVLTRLGVVDLHIYVSSAATRLEITQEDGRTSAHAVPPSGDIAVRLDNIDDEYEIGVAIFDGAGASVGSWTISFGVSDPAEVFASRFEALVQAHQDGSGRPGGVSAPLSDALRLEQQYVASGDSWKPLVACWPARASVDAPLRWSDPQPQLGTILPATDPRPLLNPPPNVISARGALQAEIQKQERPLAEIDLAEPAVRAAVDRYVEEYGKWLVTDADAASWMDAIALYAPEFRPEANTTVATTEPVAMLLSPLHPLRLAWICQAQRQLLESLDPGPRCPAAGLLDPSSCPDCAGMMLRRGDGPPQHRAFFAVDSGNPHWALLVNAALLQSEAWNTARRQLTDLGLKPAGVSGGITGSQAADALMQVAGLQPARAVLRASLVGGMESSQACTAGVARWCLAQWQDESPASGAFALEVYDKRSYGRPSEETVAVLSERTGERVRWFVTTSQQTVDLDLAVIDQLGVRAPAQEFSTRPHTPATPDALCRVRVREDFDDGRRLRESRAPGFAGKTPFTQALAHFETRAAALGGSHIGFYPLQEAIKQSLQEATFVAVSSSQIDPACMVRGSMGAGGYLWNYELPGILGGAEHRVGYYLVANPADAMRRAVDRFTRLVTAHPVDARALLEEVSKRGIPILKRLVGGGGSTRGELGMLLAVRLLQDVFRQGGAAARLPVYGPKCIHMILPIDPYARALDHVRQRISKGTTGHRGDFLVLSVQYASDPVALKITPVEVKFREAKMSSVDIRAGLSQAANLGKLLDALWVAPPPNDLWQTCRAALLAHCIDFAFRVYAKKDIHNASPEDWTTAHERVLQAVLSGQVDISVAVDGRLLVFDGSPSTTVADMDGDLRQDTAIVSQADAEALLLGAPALSVEAESIVQRLDFSLPGCAAALGQEPPSDSSSERTRTSRDEPAEVPPKGGRDEVLESGSSKPPPSTYAGSEAPTASDVAHRSEPGAGEAQEDNAPSNRVAGEDIQPPPASRVPPDIRERVRGAFEGFIGNENAVKRLSNDLLRALIEQPPHLSKNYLLTGQPSTGKTELARRIATALALPFVRLDGRGVQTRERLFDLVKGELQQQQSAPSQSSQRAGLPVLDYPPIVVFIDEVHLVPRAVQESLLTMLEAADRTVTLANEVARVHRGTFLFATTRASDVDAAFRTRCTEIQLREYVESEVAEIVRRRHPDAGWSLTVFAKIARLGRCVPRIAIELARELETAIAVAERPGPVEQHLEEVREAREMDDIGLTPLDRQYLALLEREGRPVGEQPLLKMLGTVDRDRVLDEVEPLLRRLEFIRLGPKGREITQQGREYLLGLRRRG